MNVSTPLEPLPGTPFAEFAPHITEPLKIDPDNPPWSVLGAVAVWLFSLVLIVIVPLVFLVPYIVKTHVGLEKLAEFATTDKTAIFLQIISIIPAHLLTLAAAWALVTRFGKYPFLATLGWQWERGFTFWRCVILAVGLLIVGVTIIHFFGGAETQLDKIINSSRATAFTTALLATATAPLVEEVVYRGVLYSALQRAVATVLAFVSALFSVRPRQWAGLRNFLHGGWRQETHVTPRLRVHGARIAVVVVLLLFALIHVPQYWPNFGVIATIGLLSLVLTSVRAYTGKLLPCFIIHLVFNGIQSLGIVLQPFLLRYFPDEAPGVFLVSAFAHFFRLTF